MGDVIKAEFCKTCVLNASERTQALLLAVMNEEKATYCTKEQAGLRTFLEMNAALLRRLAE